MVALGPDFVIELELEQARAELASTREVGRRLRGFANAASDPVVRAGFQSRADACFRQVPTQEATVRALEARLAAA